MILQSSFGSVQTGLGYQFFDESGALLGARVTAGIAALPETGSYAADATVPAGSVGVYWDSDTSAASEDLREALALVSVGGLSPETIAAIEAADQIFLASPYEADPDPVLVIPSPDADESLSVAYIYTEDITDAKRSGIEITFRIVASVAKSERVLDLTEKTSTTDVDGYAQITLQRDHKYRATCRDLGLDHTFTPATETFDLLTLIP